MSEPSDNDKYLGLYISYDNIPGEWMLEVIHKISNLYCTFGEITINLQNGIDVIETPIQPTNTYKLGEYMSTYIVKSYLDLVQYIIDEEDDFTVVSYISPVNIVLDSVKINDDKAIKINPYDYKLKYAYCTLQLKINNFTSSWNLFDSRLLIEKNKVKLNNFEFVENNLFENLKVNPENKILILREQGIGEEILFSSVYQESIDKFKDIKIEADKRLVSVFNRSFQKDVFVEDGYYS